MLLVWIFIGMLTAFLAALKKRNAYRWLIAGIILGPMGFLLIMCMSKIEE